MFAVQAIRPVPTLSGRGAQVQQRHGDSDWIRTNDLLLRRQLLYPAELPNR